MAEIKDNIVKHAVATLLKKHNLHESIGCIDEVVLSYVLSILEDLGDHQNPEENIDVDQFIEMMTAYIPGFSQIQSEEIYGWMFDISTKLSSQNTSTSSSSSKADEPSSNISSLLNGHSSINTSGKKPKQRSRKSSQSSTSSDTLTSDKQTHQKIDNEHSRLLLEMFPASCSIEVRHCFKMCNGDLSQTAQLILERQEYGHSLIAKSSEKKNKVKVVGSEPDQSVKDHLVAKYSFVDTEEDGRIHRPLPVKQEPKKLIRYLDSKVVNTKGQRFTEIKKSEDVELNVSLKSAKQY